MVSRDEIARVARLAKLALTPDEERELSAQLVRILEYVELLKDIDAEPDPGERDASPGMLRADAARPGLSRDDVLAQAPGADPAGGTFVVPPVIDAEPAA